MPFRNPVTTAEDPYARERAEDAIAAAAQALLEADAAADAAVAAQSTADSALTSADGKVRYFTSATEPVYTGAADTAVWRDTANGFRLNRWTGSAWQVQQFGAAAFQAGAVTATVLSGTAVDGKTITGATLRTAAAGQRVQITSAQGLEGIDSTGAVVTKVGTDGFLRATQMWLDAANGTGSVAAFSSPGGSGVALSAAPSVFAPIGAPGPPARSDSLYSELILRDYEADGTAVELRSAGSIHLDPEHAEGGRVRVSGVIEEDYTTPGTFRPLMPTRGVLTIALDASGLALIPHGLGRVPASADISPVFLSDGINRLFQPTVGALTSTHIQLVAFRVDTYARLVSTNVRVSWTAWP